MRSSISVDLTQRRPIRIRHRLIRHPFAVRIRRGLVSSTGLCLAAPVPGALFRIRRRLFSIAEVHP
jgi:hypothetical protein